MKEKLTSFFLNFDTHIKDNALDWVLHLILVVGVIAVSIISQDLAYFIKAETHMKETIKTTLFEEGERILEQKDQGYVEVGNGPMRTFRVHGDENTYYFYFVDQDTEKVSIHNVTENKWLSGEPEIPIIISVAFAALGKEQPEKIEEGTVFVGSESYQVDYTPYRVEIDNTEVYAPLPFLSNRKIRFIENYINDSVANVEVVKNHRMNDYELFYIKNKDKYYKLRSYFDDTADIALITDGIDWVEE